MGVSYSKSRGFPGSYVASVVRKLLDFSSKEKELAQARAAKTGNGSEEAPCGDDDDDDDDGDDSFLNGGHGRISWISLSSAYAVYTSSIYHGRVGVLHQGRLKCV